METITLILLALILTACLLLKLPTLYALFAGLILFCAYALKKGNSPKQIVSMLCTGVLTAKNILIVFVLIGMMTALWRACGTIPYIICHAAKLLRPEVILLVSFLLCCGISVLTGTSFGTSATIGVICTVHQGKGKLLFPFFHQCALSQRADKNQYLRQYQKHAPLRLAALPDHLHAVRRFRLSVSQSG